MIKQPLIKNSRFSFVFLSSVDLLGFMQLDPAGNTKSNWAIQED